MQVFRYWKVLAAAICLAACSADKTPEPAAPAKTVFDPLTQQLDRARQVQGTVDAQTQDTRKKVEAAENGNASP